MSPSPNILKGPAFRFFCSVGLVCSLMTNTEYTASAFIKPNSSWGRKDVTFVIDDEGDFGYRLKLPREEFTNCGEAFIYPDYEEPELQDFDELSDTIKFFYHSLISLESSLLREDEVPYNLEMLVGLRDLRSKKARKELPGVSSLTAAQRLCERNRQNNLAVVSDGPAPDT